MRRIVAVLVILVAAKASAFRGRPVSDLRFDAQGRLVAQQRLTVEAGPEGYLAVWYEWGTLRATRIDRNGNYLDGEGIILAAVSSVSSIPPIAIDGNGPSWLVVWSDGTTYARSVSRSGVVTGTGPMVIGPAADDVAVRWDGERYVMLRAVSELAGWGSEASIYRHTLSLNGVAGEAVVVAHTSHSWEMDMFFYRETFGGLSLERLGTRWLTVFTQMGRDCCHGLLWSGSRALLDDRQVLLASGGDSAAAASATEAFVTWRGNTGTFISGDVPGPSVTFAHTGVTPSVAFAQTEFVVAWRRPRDWWPWGVDGTIATSHVQPGLGVTRENVMRSDTGEWALDPSVAGDATLPALVGFIGSHPDYGGVRRAMLLFASEIAGDAFAPEAPRNLCVVRDGDGAAVTWEPVPDALGIAIDLELPDGTFRQTAVAPSRATSARVSLGDSKAVGVRMRAWNAAGLSTPSYAGFAVPPAAGMRSSTRACPGVPVTVDVTLTGTPPFTVHWSDGMVQKNLQTTKASREVTLQHDLTLSIVRVEDRSCAINELPEKIQIKVDPLVRLTGQTQDLRVRSGESATLTVTASGATQYSWFEGPRGDTSRRAGGNSARFTTPPLAHSTQYWVRVSNHCGFVDSDTIDIHVPAKRRALR